DVLLRTDTPLTGRQVHRLLSDDYSLWSIQEALKTLARIGIITTAQIGRAGVHTTNDSHAAAVPLREILDPIDILQDTVETVVAGDVVSVILFGSTALLPVTRDSDIVLAVIVPHNWEM